MERSNKKELIREAAVKVIADEGFYNTKTASIAAEAGVAVGTIYNYFENKEKILEYIFAVEFEKRMKYLQDIKEKDAPFFTKILSFLKDHFAEIKKNPALGRILVREKEFSRKKNASIGKYLNELPSLIEKILDQAVKQGEVKQINSRIVSAAVFGAIQGVVEKALADEDYALLDLAAEEIVGFLEEGI